MVVLLWAVRFPVVSVDENDRVNIEEEASRALDAEGSSDANQSAGKRVTRLSLRDVPVCLTCGLFKSYLLADPSAEEEKLSESVVSVIMNSELQVVSLYKPGGGRTMTLAKTQVNVYAMRYHVHQWREMKSGLTIAHFNIYFLLLSCDIVLLMCRIVLVQLDYDGEKYAKCLILLIDPGSSVNTIVMMFQQSLFSICELSSVGW